MKLFKSFLLGLSLMVGAAHAQVPEALSGSYGLHLFFDEREFVDVITFKVTEQGLLEGHMHVPDDFDGALENIVIQGQNIEFDLFVPKNPARPQDLVFHYRGTFFGNSYEQLVGYVTLKGESEFVASFVAFKR